MKRAPVILINERDEWRRPLLAAAEETYDETTTRMHRRAVKWIAHDRFQVEDLARLARGEACSECMEVFPCRPAGDSETLRRFREVYGDKPEPTRSNWRDLVAAGHCPICASEVSTEYFEALHHGVLPHVPTYEESQ